DQVGLLEEQLRRLGRADGNSYADLQVLQRGEGVEVRGVVSCVECTRQFYAVEQAAHRRPLACLDRRQHLEHHPAEARLQTLAARALGDPLELRTRTLGIL